MVSETSARESLAPSTGQAVGVADGSGAMFDGIAPHYDLLNRMMSFGTDRRWRRLAVRELALADGDSGEVLDIATGTADLAIAIARRHPNTRVLGIDPSRAMLERAWAKIVRARLYSRVTLATGEAEALPFDTGRFAAAIIGFGARNLRDRERGLAEITRVVRRGGRVVVLELGEPRGVIGRLARVHVHRVVPALGALISPSAYRYLSRSIAAFPPPDAFARELERAGLDAIAIHPLAFGAAHVFAGVRR
jgi:demethylmenaquinone methyltransferase/2-methoxy-6-polyprenyl-1,4-benzoquinol methylase